MYKLYEKKEIYRKKKITQDDCSITVFYDKQLGPTIKMSINDVSKTISDFDYEKFRFKNVILNADSELTPYIIHCYLSSMNNKIVDFIELNYKYTIKSIFGFKSIKSSNIVSKIDIYLKLTDDELVEIKAEILKYIEKNNKSIKATKNFEELFKAPPVMLDDFEETNI